MAKSTLIGTGDIIQLILGLLVVLGIVLISAYMLRKMQGFNAKAAKDLKVVAGLSLGAKEKVILLQAGSQQILVGVTGHSMQTLHVFDKAIIESESEGKPAFVKHLKAILERGESS